jgi:hypothetical protein
LQEAWIRDRSIGMANVLKVAFRFALFFAGQKKVKNGDDVNRVYGGQIHGAGQLA